MTRTLKRGFSLIELLVVIAIIMILMAMYMATFAKVRAKAMRVVHSESMRQEYLGREADNANAARRMQTPLPGRAECRAAFRRTLPTSEGDILVTQLLYVVRSDAEFEAYWHTLIDPGASGALEFDGRRLLARDGDGRQYELQPLEDSFHPNLREVVPVAWEFLSTHMEDNTTHNLGINVMFSDGHVEYLRYPGKFPATRTVAELTRRFVESN